MGGLFSLIGSGVLWATGFTSSGVASGSAAAAVQSTIGNVAAGSAFAAAQSAGATGAATYFGMAALGPVGALCAGVAYLLF